MYPAAAAGRMKLGGMDYVSNFMNLERQAHPSIAMEHFPGCFVADKLHDLTFDLSDTSYVRSEDYREKTQKSLSIGTDYIPCLPLDHEGITRQPVK